jgi:hypothetical protein
MRVATCGNCGMQAQTCSAAGVWDETATCLSEGPCAPATVEDDMSRCGHRQRLCGADCDWLAWETLEPQGECEPGTTVFCMGGGSVVCNEFCRAPGACVPID